MVGRKPSPLLPKKRATAKKPDDKRVKKPLPEEETVHDSPSRPKKSSVRRGLKPSAPQRQLSAEDKRAMRRRRQRRQFWIRAVALVSVIALAVVVWVNWDVLAPDQVWAWAQDLENGGTGSYPVDLSGTGARRLDQVEDYTVVLTDSHLTYLNADGAEVARYGCAYANALMATEGKYTLVAEQGARRLQLSTRNKMILEWNADLNIYAVSLNALGQVAVLTEGPQGYAVELKVYDKDGDVLYTRSSNRMVTDVALSSDGSTVSLVSVEALDGTLNTRLEVFALASADPNPRCAYTAEDTLLYRAMYLNDGTLMAVSDWGAVLMNTADGKTILYQPEGMKVLGYAVGGDTACFALRPYGDAAGGEVEVVVSSGLVQSSVTFTGEFRHLSGHGGQYALLTDSFARCLSGNGADGLLPVAADGRQVVTVKGGLVVMGLNRLEYYPNP